MFAKLAQFQNFDRRPARRPTFPAGASNDNHPAARPLASLPRTPRPRLACRWQLAPAGELEAVWEAAPFDESGATAKAGRPTSVIVTIEHIA
jgi:hypothetical protein